MGSMKEAGVALIAVVSLAGPSTVLADVSVDVPWSDVAAAAAASYGQPRQLHHVLERNLKSYELCQEQGDLPGALRYLLQARKDAVKATEIGITGSTSNGTNLVSAIDQAIAVLDECPFANGGSE